MTAPAAFSAAYSDWKLIKTRGVVQVIFEMPVEESHLAYAALGGMPDQNQSVWCAIARLTEGKEVVPDTAERSNAVTERPDKTPPPSVSAKQAGATPEPWPSDDDDPNWAANDRGRKKWEDYSPSQQAGILCDDPVFQKFLKENWPSLWAMYARLYQKDREPDMAAVFVREECKVSSRSEIKLGTPAAERWNDLVANFRAWKEAGL